MITEGQVVEAYRAWLRLKIREQRQGLIETQSQADERQDAQYHWQTFELQYLAQETR
ncbi:hypothetical protein [Ancylobacter rudongensis]|uniref:Uncharacterized protein n=1 Tax=Ancylobacter rudongensis TaxID=177413 RepID=A0A1G4UQM6_9HYPH|nr:hypothetical protein [Ancylobacter rudongensis]SCW95824.1 hypothetical protein SAMN05660859_0127 [Ancylobacter rudongensis]